MVRVVRLGHGRGLPLPEYQTAGAAGMDLLAAIDEATPWTLRPRDRTAVPTGLMIELPQGVEAQVRPRSGLAWKYGVTVLNAPGTIDSDYRGEVQVILVNLGKEPLTIRRGDRIAQMVVATVTRAKLVEGPTLSDTKRSSGGFGSTGTSTITDENAKPKKAKKKKAVPKKRGQAKPRSTRGAKRTSARAS